MTIRVAVRRAAATILAVALALQAASLAVGHSPDPPIAWPLYTADDVLEFRWMENEVPPARMRDAVVAAAAGAAATRGSRAPTIAYAANGTSTVEYGANVFCGVNGLACADGWHAPDHFHVAFRTHGHQFDWGRPVVSAPGHGHERLLRRRERVPSTSSGTSRSSATT